MVLKCRLASSQPSTDLGRLICCLTFGAGCLLLEMFESAGVPSVEFKFPGSVAA